MEDAATAEICRAQLWQWVRHGVRTAEGAQISIDAIDAWLAEELDRIRRGVGDERYARSAYGTAARLFGNMVAQEEFDEFLTLPAYELLP